MTKDKKLLYATSLIIFAVFFATLFINVGSSKIVTAVLLLPATPAVCLLIKKRASLSINKREVLLLVAVMAVFFVMLTHMSGLYFGFYKNPYFMRTKSLIDTALPLLIIIVGSEIIRYVLLSQKNGKVSVISFMICLVLEVLMFSNMPGITSFNKFMDLVGLTFFPALTSNLFYHYVSKNYGALPNIVFRAIMALNIYFLPTAASVPDALEACLKIIFPLFLLAFVSVLYAKKKTNAHKKSNKLGFITTALAVIIIVSSAMLISCQFRFGALVIATGSMTGEINKGDMIIYERYDGQSIEEGQVIVFMDRKSRIVHRVVKIENIGGEVRYYTKGDANEDMDMGYRTESDIVGLTDVKLAYVGYPTLWLRETIKNLGKEGT